MAARELIADYHIILLEANNRLGGRIYTVTEAAFDQPVEGGAEFIHGNLPITKRLLKEAGIPIIKTGGEMYRFNNGAWVEDDEQVDGWDELVATMHQVKEDMVLDDFLQQYYGEEKFTKLRNQVKRYAEGFDVADTAKVSVQALCKEWSHETGSQYRVEGGYGKLINYLADDCRKNGCEIYTNSVVKQIDWFANDVTVYTEDDKKYTASKAIITVPIIMLQKVMPKGSINFTPPLDEYVKAANDVGYGDVVKVLLQFKQPFWEEYKKNLGFIISSEWMPVWWTQLPDGTPTLTGWLGGPRATALRGETNETIIEKCVQSLCTIFGISKNDLLPQLTAARVFNWANDESAGGAYSYITPRTIAALDILNTPVAGTLFFAGEALYDGISPGTVEAAFTTGKNVAKKIKAE